MVAVWREARATPFSSTFRFKDAKETLTDQNGEWSITGPKGEIKGVNEAAWLASAVLGNYFTADPEFFIYKPGYGRPNLEPGSFTACAYVSQKNNMEGIVLALHGKTEEERKQYEEEYERFSASPFVPVKDPETKLRNLDFSLQYPANATKLGFEWVRPYFQYTVTGLARATTREERLRASMVSTPSESKEKTTLLNRRIKEEEEQLLYGQDTRRKKK